MNGLNNEYIMRICEEILLRNKDYQELNKEILEKELTFKSKLDKELKEEYSKIEELVIKSISHLSILIYSNK